MHRVANREKKLRYEKAHPTTIPIVQDSFPFESRSTSSHIRSLVILSVSPLNLDSHFQGICIDSGYHVFSKIRSFLTISSTAFD